MDSNSIDQDHSVNTKKQTSKQEKKNPQKKQAGIMEQTLQYSTPEVKRRESGVQGQPWLHVDPVPTNKTKIKHAIPQNKNMNK